MPQNLDFNLYFNILFFSVIGIGFIVGYFRGLKKTLYSLIVVAAFYAFFFITIDQVINALWDAPLSFAFAYAESAVPGISAANTLGDALVIALDTFAGDTLGAAASNEQLLLFATGLAQFVLKLVYTILYFTVGYIIYRLLTFIIRVLFFNGAEKKYEKNMKKFKKGRRSAKKSQKKAKRSKKARGYDYDEIEKPKKPKKYPLLGGLAGAAKGALAAYVTLIVFGGMLNIMESMLQVIPEDQPTVSREVVEQIYLANTPTYEVIEPVQMASPIDVPAGYDEQLDLARDLIAAFNANIFVSNASSITYTTADYDNVQIPMHLYLFDSVLSFNYDGTRIMFRNELDVIGDTAAVLMESEYVDSGEITDITPAEVTTLFTTLSNSDLITSLIPLGIEVGSEMYEAPIDIPVEDLYEIDWQAELQTIGAIAATGFSIINAAGIWEEGVDLQTVTLDGTEVKTLFDDMAASDLITTAASFGVELLVEQMGEDAQAIITVPSDLDWANEIAAFGEVAKAVLDTNITMGDIESGDPSVLIGALSTLDFTVLLNSQIVTNALINVLSGNAGIEGLDMLTIPDGIEWVIYDNDGNVIGGELQNILLAFNAITDVAEGFDLNNISLQIIADFDNDTIDALFDSEILVASISEYLLNMDLGDDMPLLIPDSVLDSNGWITATEMKAVASSARVLVTDLACDEGDTVCEETGFDVTKAFTLSDTSIDTVTSSGILAATLGNLILEQGGDVITVPVRALSTISVDGVNQDVVGVDEVKRMFKAVSTLGFTDMENMAFDASILSNLSDGAETNPMLDTDKTDILFASYIIHATLSTMLFDLTEGDEAVMQVPYFNEDETVEIRVYNATDDLEYLAISELEDILQALITIDIADFNAVDSLDLGQILENKDIILDSSILQATISKQVLDLGSDTINVPYRDVDDNDIRITVGDAGDGTESIYLARAEIEAILDALDVLGITDMNSFDGNVDMASILAPPTDPEADPNITRLLNSATIHATISKQLLDMETDGTIAVPYKDIDDNDIRITVTDGTHETEYIVKSEVEAMIDALDVLGLTSDINTFDGNVDIASILAPPENPGDPENIDVLLSSATIHATISDQLFAVTELSIPFYADDDTTEIRVVRTDGTNPTEYIIKPEIKALVDALDVLGLTDNIDGFDGNIDMSLITADPAPGEPSNIDILLLSSTIQATISAQMIDLTADGATTSTFVIPYWEETASTGGYVAAYKVRILVGNEGSGTNTEYLSQQEIKDLVEALDVLGITNNIDTFDGGVDIATVMSDPANIAIVLESATLQATISRQLLDLDDIDGTLQVPFVEEDDSSPVRVTVSTDPLVDETEYITASEIEAMFTALNTLGITDDIENFNGSVDLSILDTDGKIDDVVNSSIIQATISEQIIDVETSATVAFVVPYWDDDTVTPQAVRITVGTTGQPDETLYVWSTEIKNIIKGMQILGITDVSTFNGDIDLTSFLTPGADRDTLLLSNIMKATISQQLINLDDVDDAMIVPEQDIDTNEIRIETGTLGVDDNVYVLESEIRAMFDALNTLGLTNINDFTGSINLTNVYGETNQDIILSSASMHATISEQIIDLDTGLAGSPVIVPDNDVAGTSIRSTVAGTEFLIKAEIKGMIDGLEVLQITDVTSFGGTFNFTLLDETLYPGSQDKLLSSATIHKTITTKLLDLDDAVLIVPDFEEDTVTEIRTTAIATEYVVRNEIKSLINAFLAMGYNDLDNFGASLNSSEFFSNRATLLLSSSIQATLSDKLLNDTQGELIVPDNYFGTANLIRIAVGSVTYVHSTEIDNLMAGLEEMGLTDFTSFGGTSFGAGTVLASDFSIVLASESLQATISDNILATANDETQPYGSTTLIVPNYYREDITVATDAVTYDQIEATELENMLTAMNTLGLTGFGSAFDASAITSMNDTELTTMLASKSVHTTIDNMLRGNANLDFPSLGTSTSFEFPFIEYITYDWEIKAFIKATNTLATGDFTNVTFNLTIMSGLSSAQRGVVADSMIVRDTLTEEIETLETTTALVSPGSEYGVPFEYEAGSSPQFFTKTYMLAIIEHYYPAAS